MLVEHLKKELTERSRRNPRYSLRSFAKALKIDSSTLSALLNCRRPLTPKTAQKLIGALDLDSQTKEKFLAATLGSSQAPTLKTYNVLDSEIFDAISSWEHFAVLSLLETRNCKHNVTSIAHRLNIGTGVVIDVLARLERLGLIRRNSGRWYVAKQDLASTTDIPSSALRKAHCQTIEKALYALENQAIEERDITGMTMAISKKKLPEAKRMIKEFRWKLCEYLETGEKDEVYRINIQLFSLEK